MRLFIAALLMILGTQAWAECGNLCNEDWWKTATTSDVKAKLTKNKKPYLLVTATGLGGKNFRMFCWGWDGQTDLPLYSLCVAEIKKTDFGFQTSMSKVKLLRI